MDQIPKPASAVQLEAPSEVILPEAETPDPGTSDYYQPRNLELIAITVPLPVAVQTLTSERTKLRVCELGNIQV
jgi:hypothetical protein